MGGKNHQPCSRYSKVSTKLSRSLSLANAELELGNVAFEDALLGELTGRTGLVYPTLNRLVNSCSALTEALGHCSQLRKEMEQNDFVDPPTLQDTDLWGVAQRFCDNQLLSETQQQWAHVIRLLQGNGFRSVLEVIESRIRELLRLTTSLQAQINALRPVVNEGKLSVVLEENRPGNIKVAFARLYTAWTEFNQFFLASSLFSTELWYLDTGCGSLCPEKTKVQAV